MIDRALLSELQLALIEPPDGGDSWPSGIWTRVEALDALNAGLRALCRDVHLHIAGVIIPVVAGTTVITLPTDWLATAYCGWHAGTVSVNLGPVDSFEADFALPGWETTPGQPIAYADLDGAMRTLRLVPTPNVDGSVVVVYVTVPPLVTAVLPGTTLPVPEECTSAVKYSALGTLLRKVGRLLDAERADYCDRRYELTRVATAIILDGWS